jgi:hypothetical protein
MIIKDQIRRFLRQRKIGTNYRGMVAKVGPLVDDRVQFHIAHLDEYWWRCLAFLEIWKKENKILTLSYLKNDLFVCVRIATEVATLDVESFCSKRPGSGLRNAWQKYLDHLAITKKKTHEVSIAITNCVQCFTEARDLYRAMVAAESQVKKK